MKAQSEIISSVVIIIIAITLVSTAYMWGMPLIQKRQDTAQADRAFSFFDRNNYNSLVKKIEYVAKNGGDDTFSVDINGIWTLYPCSNQDGGQCSCDQSDACTTENNSIEFSFSSKVSNLAVNSNWIPINSPNTNTFGTLGIDDSSVVLGRADSTANGYNITYKVWFRQLIDSQSRGYKIDLLPSGSSGIRSSVGKSVKISNAGTRTSTLPNGETLIITEIKILLI